MQRRLGRPAQLCGVVRKPGPDVELHAWVLGTRSHGVELDLDLVWQAIVHAAPQSLYKNRHSGVERTHLQLTC
jgi:hypothetical protein